MLNDLKYAVRWLRRSPGFALIAIVSLGLGIGANTAMFSLIDAVLLRPLPVADPDSLVDLFTSGGDGDEYATTSYPDFLDLKAQNTVFSDMTGYTPMFAPLNLRDRSRLVIGQVVTSNHFDVLGVRPFLGRLLQPHDDEPGADRVVVLSHRMWRADFGSDPGVVGRSLQLRGLPFTIVGVAPASFTGVIPLVAPELWLPVAHNEEVEPAGINWNTPSPTGKTRLERRGSRWLFIKARLKPGESAAAAHANVAVIGEQLAAANPVTNRNARISAVPTSDVRMFVPQAGGPLRAGSAGIMGIVALVLLIACANVAGMLLARASARTREISVRLAIGASRRQIIRQMLCEGLVLGACGAAVAVALAWVLLRALLSIELPLPGAIALEVPLDARVLGFTLLIAVAAGTIAALTPALKASSLQLAADLRGAIQAARVGRWRWPMRDLLVVAQLALTAVLLVVAGLLLRTLDASQSADVGFRMRGVAAVSADTDMVRYAPDRAEQFWAQALERVRAIPGVTDAGIATPRLPFDVNFSQTAIHLSGKSYGTNEPGEIVSNVSVTPGYFAALEIPIVEGRDFTDADRKGSPLVAIINQTMARRFWPGQSAVGKTFAMATAPDSICQVVGVTRDHRVHTVAERPVPYLHFSAAQRPARYNFVVAQGRGDATQLLTAIRHELLALEPGLVFISSSTMDARMAMSLLPQRIAATLAGGFGAVGTLLAAIGLYGVIAFSVARRTREIGVRVAVGAGRGDVLLLIVRQGLALILIGTAAGLALAALVANALSGALYGVDWFDPMAWMAAVVVLFVAAIAANLIPARRAMKVDPITALRAE
jgi:macrolide transport system ATP-binding/permease protein